MNIPAADFGEAAARSLLNLLRGQPADLPTFPPTLTLRESVGRYR
jgi:hypothetical protein